MVDDQRCQPDGSIGALRRWRVAGNHVSRIDRQLSTLVDTVTDVRRKVYEGAGIGGNDE